MILDCLPLPPSVPPGSSSESSQIPDPSAPSSVLPASPESQPEALQMTKVQEEALMSLGLDPSSTETMRKFGATKRLEPRTWKGLDATSLGERIFLATNRLTPEEKLIFLLLLERGDFHGLARAKRREKKVQFVSKKARGLGVITVSANAIDKGKAQRAADSYVTDLGDGESLRGMRKLISWLEQIEDDPKLPADVRSVLAMARKAPHTKLSRLLAECKSNQPRVVKWALEGARQLGDSQWAAMKLDAQPAVMQNLIRIATSGVGPCPKCKGEGLFDVQGKTNAKGKACTKCRGTGENPEHPELLGAVKTFLEASGHIGKKGDVNVGVRVQVDQPGGASDGQLFLARQMEMMELISAGQAQPAALPPAPEVVEEAELVVEADELVLVDPACTPEPS